MKRCPTVPVAPRTATLRLRIAVKFDVSEERRGKPAALRVNPAHEAEPRLCKRRKHLVVVHDVPAIDPNLPVTMCPARDPRAAYRPRSLHRLTLGVLPSGTLDRMRDPGAPVDLYR